MLENGSQPVLSFTARVPDVFPRNGKFINPNTGKDFNLRRLTYTLVPAINGEKNLVLRQNPVLMDLDEDELKYPLVLAQNVQKFSVECWDTQTKNGPTNGRTPIPIPSRCCCACNSSWAAPVLRESAGSDRDAAVFHAVANHARLSTRRTGWRTGQSPSNALKISLHSSRRGFAVIMVMIAITVLSIMAGALAIFMKVESHLAQNSNDSEKLLWLGRSGAERACWILAQEPPGGPR